MCRVLAYLGTPILIKDLLYSADSSLIKQTYDPKMLQMLNLAGFGITAWGHSSDQADIPFTYRTTDIPVFDPNLNNLSQIIRSHCLLAHVRGVPYSHTVQIGPQNLHPFRYEGIPMAFAHNGELANFREMRNELLEHIKPEISKLIVGSTDSEWIYALFLSQFDRPELRHKPEEIVDAIAETLAVLRQVRESCGIRTTSAINLFVCDGHNLVATRFTFDFGCYGTKVSEADLSYLSLWFTFGKDYGFHDGEWKMKGGPGYSDSVIVSSEPLTCEVSTWLEIPEYSALYVTSEGNRRIAKTIELSV